LTQNFACFLAADFGAEALMMVIAGISDKPTFAVAAFFAAMLGLHSVFSTVPPFAPLNFPHSRDWSPLHKQVG
jgi:hypothetical protein